MNRSLNPTETVLSYDGITIVKGQRVQTYKLVTVGADQVVRDRLHVVDATDLKSGDVVQAGDVQVVFMGDGKFRDAINDDTLNGAEDDQS